MVAWLLRQTGEGFPLTRISALETHAVGFLHGFFEDSLPDSLLRNNSIVQIPFEHELSVSIDMYVSRAMISLPRDKDVIRSPYLSHD